MLTSLNEIGKSSQKGCKKEDQEYGEI